MEFLSPEQTRNAPERVGPKARRLAEVRARGFPVPDFVVLVGVEGPDGPWGRTGRERLVPVLESLSAPFYAIRSCAREEDGTSSHAGRFRTRLDVPPAEVVAAVEDVWRDARARGAGAGFTVILQRCVRADRAGVAFTRHPLGHPHMVVEWVDGPGAGLAGGTASPLRTTFLRHQRPSDGPVPTGAVEWFLRAEALFGHPQDIEWAMEKGSFWFLQSRPITSISSAAAEALTRIDADLPPGPFLYEKTEQTEAAPRPSPITWELLNLLYADDGPVSRAYRRIGVRYRASEFLRRVDGALYVDRDREVAGLFPSLTALPGPGLRWRSLSGVGRTLSNAFCLRRFSVGDVSSPAVPLATALAVPPAQDVPDALKRVLTNYETVFEVNLRAARALSAAEEKLGRTISPSEWASADLPGGPWAPPGSMEGNSLELTDTNPFRPASFQAVGGPTDAAPLTRAVALWARWREVARWVTVKDISALRAALRARARGWDDPDLSFYGSLAGDVSPAACQERRTAHRVKEEFHGPSRLAPSVWEEPGGAWGVSSGVAEGILSELNHPFDGAEGILWLDDLSVTWAPLLDRVRGVLACRGGVLSHLAILAREKGLPVVVDPGARHRLRAGDRVRLNGTAGQVEKAGNDPR